MELLRGSQHNHIHDIATENRHVPDLADIDAILNETEATD